MLTLQVVFIVEQEKDEQGSREEDERRTRGEETRGSWEPRLRIEKFT